MSDITSHVNPVGYKEIKGKEYEKSDLAPEDLEERWLRWKCLVCNFVYEGSVELKVCPKCGNADPDKFSDSD